MRIAVSARTLKFDATDGIGMFTREIVNRLTTGHPEHKFLLVFDRKPDTRFTFPSNTETTLIRPATKHPVLWYTWHEWQLPEILNRWQADIFLSPDGIIPLRSNVPSVSVIHDINFYHRPSDLPFFTRHYYNIFFRIFAENAARVITVSEFCRRDISSTFKTDLSKIDVALNGVSEYFSNPGRESTGTFRDKLTGGIPYFLFVSNFSPRKNIPGLIKGFESFRRESGKIYKLVLTGGRLYLNSETDKMIKSSPFSGDFIVTGPVNHKDLNLFYSAAEALTFVPWFEGFGIPAAEAMRCQIPVILSDRTSLPEIGGEAALYADPADPGSIAAAMIKISSDGALRARLSEEGYFRSLKFTWDNTAASVWRSVEKVMQK